jgi:Domain of unknown function (DUF4333)
VKIGHRERSAARVKTLTVAWGVLALTLVGCGQTIDAPKVERALRGRAPTGGPTVVSARCPGDVAAKAYETFDCDVKLSDGTEGTWTIHIDNSQGVVLFGNSDFTTLGRPRKAGPSEVGQAKLVSAPGGIKLKATLLSFVANVKEPSPNINAHIAGVWLRITNLGHSTYRDHEPSYLSIAHDAATAGLDMPPNETGSCGGSFYQTPLRIPPRVSVQGCIPLEVFANPVVDFVITLGGHTLVWKLD